MSQFAGDPQFSRLLAGRQDVDLVQLMLELAADAYPGLDRMECLLEIDRLGVACTDQPCWQLAHDLPGRLTLISRFLYEVEGFHGNREAYYEPRNSYLNDVLARRTGIPISLGILYMAVAARAGLKMFGVNTPGHFVVGGSSIDGTLFVDPFTNGDVLPLAACRCRVLASSGHQVAVSTDDFRPAAPRDIVARVLRNLKAAYAMQNEWRAVLDVQERLTALLPHVAQERRDLALVYLRLGKPLQAVPMLHDYLEHATCAVRGARGARAIDAHRHADGGRDELSWPWPLFESV